MPVAEIEIEIYCATCGEGLCNQSTFTNTYNRQQPSFRVEACHRCLEKARDEGYGEGYDEGYEAARDEFDEEKEEG